MSITQKKYIDVISGVGGEAEAGRKSMDARIMTASPLAPVNTVLEFYAAKEVAAFFGADSKEAAFSAKYFGFISKSISRAGQISFARYTPQAVAPVLRATRSNTTLSDWQSISAGSMIVSLNGQTYQLQPVNFAAAATLSDVAESVQAAVRANAQAGETWAQAKVSYNNNVFTLEGGAKGAFSVDFAAAEDGDDISHMLGWNQASMPVVSNGWEAENVTQALDRAAGLSGNFGSFTFMEELAVEDIAAAARWTDVQNVQYMYSVNVSPANYLQVKDAVKGQNGVALTYDINNGMAEFMPMALMAATDYNRTGGVINFMYQKFPAEKPAVTETALSDALDALLINYLGQTQQAGRQITFYQRGFLQGEVSDMGVFANEIWLKDALVTEWLNMFLALNKIPANDSGVSRMRAAAQAVIDEAKNNGTILPGKTLTQLQKVYIFEQTGEEDAWRQVESQGYWLKPVLTQRVSPAGEVEYLLNYILIYSKGDSIRKVEGSNILI